MIVDENSTQLSVPFALWNRRAMMKLIKALFGHRDSDFRLSVNTCCAGAIPLNARSSARWKQKPEG